MIKRTQAPLQISYLASGGLITNYFCSSACRHCLYRSSPRWPKDYIDPDTTRKNFETLARLGCRSIHIGGGEPLLRPEGLASVLRVARETGVSIEYVETNSSWYRGREETCSLLEQLREQGLSTLLISISPFHTEHIPFYKVKGVLAACQETGISIFPWVSGFIEDLEAFDDRQPHSLETCQQRFGENYIKTLPRRYWISPGGRALETFGAFSPKIPVEQLLEIASDRCTELCEVSHFHIDLYGNYIPGLCSGLAIRREDLGAPLNADAYPLLSRLYAGGIRQLYDYAVEEYGFAPAVYSPPGRGKGWVKSDTGYASKCALCYDIRRFLVVEKQLDTPELQPRGHYLYG